MRRLTSEEEEERKKNRDVVAEADLRIEVDWRQRSQQLWLSAGDANTRFFHMAASGRRRQNCIRRMLVGDRTLTDQSSIGLALADYFREFYRRGPSNKWRWSAKGVTTLSPGQQQELIFPVTEEEVLVAIRELNSEGAPGPDGILVFFYRDCRDAVGPEVMATIEDFWAGRCNMDRLNRAYIILIPKVEGAERIGDFRPISLSNSIYLIIAKVLANRLRTVLPGLISPFQSAFLPGRQMADNIVLAEEIVASWRRNGTPGFLWKVDFSKAYDSLDWQFLWNVSRWRGFPETWIRWVKQCVTTPTFVVLVNGRPQGGWIHPQRGIRQGCPLALLLFILAADALAVCTSQLCSSGAFAGFQSPNIPGGIPLLQYADDTTFFIQGSWAAAHTLSIMMDIFSDFSGLHLNRAKSSFIGFGLSSEELVGCARILATPIGALSIRYLGVPLVDRRLRIRDWQPVMDKVEMRLGGWRARFLSRGGGAWYCLRRYYRLSRHTSWPYSGCQRGSVAGWSQSCGVFTGVARDKKGRVEWHLLHGRTCVGQFLKVVWESHIYSKPTRPSSPNGWLA